VRLGGNKGLQSGLYSGEKKKRLGTSGKKSDNKKKRKKGAGKKPS